MATCLWTLLATAMAVGVVAGDSLTLLSSAACGATHGCWRFPADCKDDQCHGMVQWKELRTGHYEIRMQGKDASNFDSGRYIAVGFSEDGAMGDDTVLECVVDADGASGQTYMSFNQGKSNIQLLDASEKLMKKKKTLLKDGKLVCSFELDMTAASHVDKDEKSMIYDLGNSTWTLLYASGAVFPATGEKLIHSLEEGSPFFPWQTEETVSLTSQQVVTKSLQ